MKWYRTFSCEYQQHPSCRISSTRTLTKRGSDFVAESFLKHTFSHIRHIPRKPNICLMRFTTCLHKKFFVYECLVQDTRQIMHRTRRQRQDLCYSNLVLQKIFKRKFDTFEK